MRFPIFLTVMSIEQQPRLLAHMGTPCTTSDSDHGMPSKMFLWDTLPLEVDNVLQICSRGIVDHIFPKTILELQAVSHSAVIMPLQHALSKLGLVLVRYIRIRVVVLSTNHSANCSSSAP